MKPDHLKRFSVAALAILCLQWSTLTLAGSKVTNLSLVGNVAPTPSECNFGQAAMSLYGGNNTGTGSSMLVGQGTVPITCSAGAAYTVSSPDQWRAHAAGTGGFTGTTDPAAVISTGSDGNITSVSMIGTGTQQHVAVRTAITTEEDAVDGDNSTEQNDSKSRQPTKAEMSTPKGDKAHSATISASQAKDTSVATLTAAQKKKRQSSTGRIPVTVAF